MIAVRVRPADVNDSQDLFAWRNDDVTLNNSLSTQAVVWEDHAQWFAASLLNSNRILLISVLASSVERKVGVVRFDIDKNHAVVSINMAPCMRGKRLAQPSLKAAIDFLTKAHSRVSCLTAQIKSSNTASRKVFESVGFALHDSVDEVLTFSLPIVRTE